MTIADTLSKFEEKRFLDLTREDAECIADTIDKESGEETGILATTENTIKDASFTSSHPWFVPYVMATEYVEKLPFSPEIAEYLRTHPVVPGNEIFARDVPDGTAPQVSVPPKATVDNKTETVQISNETPGAHDEEQQTLRNRRRPAKIDDENNTPPVEKNSSIKSNPPRHDSRMTLKFQKISQCFSAVVAFVSKGTLPVPVYFESVVLPYIIKKDANVTSILTARKPGSMDEITFALASYDNGVTLSSVGFEMISSVLRAAHVKYGDSRVRPIINRAIRPAGDDDLHSAYMRCFPRYPATLDLILSNLKVGIMDLKK